MMEFEDYLMKVDAIALAPEHVNLIRRTRRVGREAIGPTARAVDAERRFPHEAMAALHAAGLTTLYVPEDRGGLGFDPADSILPQVLITMELSSWCSSTAQIYGSHSNVQRYIGLSGKEVLQTYFYKEAVEGRFFASFGAEGSGDKFAIGSRLEPSGADYRLTGRKHFATSSTGSAWAYWIAVTPDGQLRMPMVDLRAPGIVITDSWNGVGQRGTGSGQVAAEDVAVPADHVMTGDDYDQRLRFLENAMHLNFAAQYAGVAMGAYRAGLAYVREKARPWRGLTSATQDPYLRLRIGDMAVKVNAARQLVIHAAHVYEQLAADPAGDALTGVAVSQAKVLSTETALDVTRDIFQVMGASSATTTHGFDRYFRDARTLTLHDPVDRRRELIGMVELGSDEDFAAAALLSPKDGSSALKGVPY